MVEQCHLLPACEEVPEQEQLVTQPPPVSAEEELVRHADSILLHQLPSLIYRFLSELGTLICESISAKSKSCLSFLKKLCSWAVAGKRDSAAVSGEEGRASFNASLSTAFLPQSLKDSLLSNSVTYMLPMSKSPLTGTSSALLRHS